MQRNTGTWMAFLAMTFAIVGLVGLFASYAAPLPLQRALARDATLDQALATGDDKAALEPLRDQLGDSASMVIEGAGPLAARVSTARADMNADFLREAAAVAARLRLMLAVVTVVAAGFGVALLGIVARAPQGVEPRQRAQAANQRQPGHDEQYLP